jgi:hypothetical protein
MTSRNDYKKMAAQPVGNPTWVGLDIAVAKIAIDLLFSHIPSGYTVEGTTRSFIASEGEIVKHNIAAVIREHLPQYADALLESYNDTMHASSN